MTLTARLMVFFLTVFALVLAGFSISLYLLADDYLHRQLDERAQAALKILVAAAEVHSGKIDWEPLERVMSLGQDDAPDQMRWIVHDAYGRIVERSPNSASETFPEQIDPSAIPETPDVLISAPGSETWSLWQTRLQADGDNDRLVLGQKDKLEKRVLHRR